MVAAYKAQQQKNLARAVELWQSVSHIAQAEKDISLEGKAFSNLGYIYGLTKEWDKAIKACDQAIRLNPDDAAPYNIRGIVYSKKGNYEKAFQDYNKAIKLNPDDLCLPTTIGETPIARKGKLVKSLPRLRQSH